MHYSMRVCVRACAFANIYRYVHVFVLSISLFVMYILLIETVWNSNFRTESVQYWVRSCHALCAYVCVCLCTQWNPTTLTLNYYMHRRHKIAYSFFHSHTHSISVSPPMHYSFLARLAVVCTYFKCAMCNCSVECLHYFAAPIHRHDHELGSATNTIAKTATTTTMATTAATITTNDEIQNKIKYKKSNNNSLNYLQRSTDINIGINAHVNAMEIWECSKNALGDNGTSRRSPVHKNSTFSSHCPLLNFNRFSTQAIESLPKSCSRFALMRLLLFTW